MEELRHGSDTTNNSVGCKEAATERVELSTIQGPPASPSAPLKLNEANAVEHTAYTFSTRKKWIILTVVALCQTSMSE